MLDKVNVVVLVTLSVIGTILAAQDVRLSTGIARGYDVEAKGTLKPYSAYYGIPFAEPPVGELRFLPPRPFLGRDPDAVITSSRYRAACYQIGLPQSRLSEDCLHLNVFTPADVAFGPQRKVMVWIHGGGFFIGDASIYVPSKLVTENDVIVVTIQYRLGAFGFLSSGDAALPGNLGLHDQVLALQWVKDNIRRFGGDPDDVTIFGESVGSASVAAMSLTPATRGLFSKAIMQSGTILSPWALNKNPWDQFYQHARDTKCFPRIYNPWNKQGYHESIVACMRRKSPMEILDAAEEAYLQQVGALDRAYILGVNDNEGLILASGVPRREYSNFTRPSNVASLIQSTVSSYLRSLPTTETLNLVDFIYTFPKDANGAIPIQNILDLNSDMSYNVPMILFARALNKASSSIPIFLYVFNAEPKGITVWLPVCARHFTNINNAAHSRVPR